MSKPKPKAVVAQTAEQPPRKRQAVGATPTGGTNTKTGRPSKYTPELVAAICERLSKGEPMARICDGDGMPAYRTVKDWIDEKDEKGKATERGSLVSAAIARAREEGYDAIAQDALDIADDGSRDYLIDAGDGVTKLVLDRDHVQRSKLRVETRLKLLAKWYPSRYGDAVTLKGDKNAPLAPPTINLTLTGPRNG